LCKHNFCQKSACNVFLGGFTRSCREFTRYKQLENSNWPLAWTFKIAAFTWSLKKSAIKVCFMLMRWPLEKSRFHEQKANCYWLAASCSLLLTPSACRHLL
jgi:hypothetical protein